MKIGEISKLSGLSVETIRYYISLGLLNPVRRKKQYHFSMDDWNDLQRIQALKEMRFSLKDIETVIRFGRTSNWVEPEIWKEYKSILQLQRQTLQMEQQSIQQSIQRIAQELDKVSRHSEATDHAPSGIPLKALSLLTCPRCGKPLHIEQAYLSCSYIMDGNILCTCGYYAKIEHGILKTENRYTGSYDSPDLGRQLYSSLSNELLKAYQHCCAVTTEELNRINLRGKSVLESCINGYFYLYNHFPQLRTDCLYIVTDKYPEMLYMYKKLIERLDLKLDILYIADDSAELPLAEQSIDVCVDFFSCTEWSLYKQDEYPHAMRKFFAPECQVVGSFMDIPPFSQTTKNLKIKYPECASNVLCFKSTCDLWQQEGFSLTSQLYSQIKKTRNCFSFTCHVDGDNLSIYTYRAWRETKI